MTSPSLDAAPAAANRSQQELLRGLARFRCGLASSDDFSTTLLAVDVDVIQMYLSPRRGAGYAALHNAGAADQVNQTEEAPAAALASALASYILFELPKKCANKTAMLLMPSHSDELLQVYGAMLRSAAKVLQDAQERIDAIAQATANLQATTGVSDLTGRIRALVDLLFARENPLDEILRLNELVKAEQLIHLERFKLPSGFYLPTVEADSEYEGRLAGYAKFASLDATILNSRKDARPLATRDQGKLIRDLEALAALESVASPMQIVSGAPRMSSLARKIESASAFPSLVQNLVVDPLAFLPNLFDKVCGEAGAKVEISRLIGTFDQLLYPIYERAQSGVDYEVWLGNVSRSTSGMDGNTLVDVENDFPDKAIAAWKDLSQVLFAGMGDGTMVADAVEEKVQKLLSKIDSGDGTLVSLIESLNQLLTSKTESMHSAATTQFLLQLGAGSVPRNAPPLRLSDLPKIKQIARQIGKRRTRESATDFEANLTEALKDDSTHYSRYLLVGMSFTTVNLWKNAERAFDEACKRAPTAWAGGIITGSEAAYGKAVSLRVLSKQPEDIFVAQVCLADAARRASRKQDGFASDIRFQSEELSQWVVYRWLCSGPAPSGLRSFQAFNFRFLTELQKRDPLTTMYELVLNLEEYMAPPEPDLLVREYVLQQLLCNLFQAYWLDRFRFSFSHDGRKNQLDVYLSSTATKSVLSSEQLMKMTTIFKAQCSRLRDGSDDLNLPFPSELALFVSHLAQLQFLSNDPKERVELRDVLLRHSLEKARVMPIDGVRYDVMRKLAQLFEPELIT